jgi:WD40 repeat protein
MKGINLPADGHVKALAFSRQGEMFAFGTYEGKGGVTVWDLATGDVKLRRWEGVGIHAVAFSPDGQTLAAAGEGEIHLWDFGWKAEKTLPGGAGPSSIVASLAFSEDGRTLASGVWVRSEGDVMCIHLSDVESGKTRGLPETCVECSSVAISPDGKALAADGGAGTLSLWALPNGTGRRDFSTGLPCINALAFSPDGTILALSGDVCIQFWDPIQGTRLGEMKDPAGDVFCLAYSPKEGRVATGGGRVVLWDVATRTEVGVAEADYGDAVFGIALSPDGEIAATACWDKKVRLRDISGVGR